MNRPQARKIAELITNEQLKAMFEKAKQSIKDWTKTSNSNVGMTRGTVWNLIAADFDESVIYPTISKTNMIREFGEFLPWEMRNPRIKNEPVHEEPKL